MKTKWTFDEWLAGRVERRRAADRVSPAPCGRQTSRDDAGLRAGFGGARNRPFLTTEELAVVSAEAAARLRERPGR